MAHTNGQLHTKLRALGLLLLCCLLLGLAGCSGATNAMNATDATDATEPSGTVQTDNAAQTDGANPNGGAVAPSEETDAEDAVVPEPETAQNIAIRLATDFRRDAIGYRTLEEFARLLEEKSAGTVQVKLYRGGEWSKSESFAEYLRLGTLEMACLTQASAELLQPAYLLYRQPYLFTAFSETAQQYIQGAAAQTALSALPAEYHGLSFVPDGYLYLVQFPAPGGLEWRSYGELKRLGETKALEGAVVYDLQAVYSLQPLAAQTEWWNSLNETQQGWITESLREAIDTSFAQQATEPPSQALLASGVVFQDAAATAQSGYAGLFMQQREEYFATHADALTAHWRVAPVIGGEEEPSQ